MKTKSTCIAAAILGCATLVSAFAAEPVLEFKVNKDGPRTAGMLGPSHDEEMIYGLGSASWTDDPPREKHPSRRQLTDNTARIRAHDTSYRIYGGFLYAPRTGN